MDERTVLMAAREVRHLPVLTGKKRGGCRP